MRDADFETLSNDPQRKLVFLLDSAGLAALLPITSTRDRLLAIGYDPQHIERLRASGHRFRVIM